MSKARVAKILEEKENIAKIFEEIEFIIKNAKNYPNISDEIYRIYNQNPQDFLAAIQFITPMDENSYKKTQSLLHLAVEQGQLEIIATISEIYALSRTVSKSYSRESSSKNVKHPRSILGREISGLRIIIPKKNEILELKDSGGVSLLHSAVKMSFYELNTAILNIAKWLIKKGANINSQDRHSSTPLMKSVLHRNSNFVYLLLENKADLEVLDREGDSALHCAIHWNLTEFVKELLKHGADINHLYQGSNNALCIASSRGRLDMIKLLLKHAEENSIKLKNIESAIDVAKGDSKEEIIEILKARLESYGTPYVKDISKENIVKMFQKIEHVIENAKKYPDIRTKIYQVYEQNPQDFLEAIQFVPKRYVNESPLLHKAVVKSELEIIAAISEIYSLSESGSSKNKILELKDFRGCSLLHMATICNSIALVKWLINKGVDINTQNNFYLDTPLIISVIVNYPVFSLLAQNKADMHILDRDGYSALHRTVRKNLAGFVKELLNYGADINHLDLNGRNSLFLASSYGYLEIIKTLVEYAKENSIKLENIDSAIAAANGPQAGEIIEILDTTLESYEAKVEEALSIELASVTPSAQRKNIYNLRV